MPDVAFPPFAQTLVLLACLALGAAHYLWGPTRSIKIGVALFALAVVSVLAVYSGRPAVLGLLAVIGLVNFLVMGAAVLLHSMPLEKTLAPVDLSSCPPHGRRKVEEWTRGFGGLGFSRHGDFETEWRFAGRTRKSFIRFLIHDSRTTWVEIHVLDEPKMAARLVASRGEGGIYIATVDRQANEEFFRDSLTRILRTPSAATCFDMVRRHEARVGEAGARQRIEDPPAVHVENYEEWIRRLVESRQLVARDSAARIPLRLVPPTVLRVMAAWFH